MPWVLRSLIKLVYVVPVAVFNVEEAVMDKPDGAADKVPRPVLVLTQHPEDYGEKFREMGLDPLFANNFEDLLKRLNNRPVSGFVLELAEVLRSPSLERGHFFHLSEAFPLLRVRRREGDNSLTYLDDPGDFMTQVRRFWPRLARLAPRVPVMLEALVAAGDDPEFTAPMRGAIFDVSTSGGLVNSELAFEENGLLRLRIAKLSDPTPITADICWHMTRGRNRLRHCVGVRFREIRPGQVQELEARALSGCSA
jgi:hypothetical protein